eukprot:scaffold62986_cov17-Tisochrysis_lutea.AAC.1
MRRDVSCLRHDVMVQQCGAALCGSISAALKDFLSYVAIPSISGSNNSHCMSRVRHTRHVHFPLFFLSSPLSFRCAPLAARSSNYQVWEAATGAPLLSFPGSSSNNEPSVYKLHGDMPQSQRTANFLRFTQ